MKFAKRIIVVGGPPALLLIALATVSGYVAFETYNSDFPVFYRAGRFVLEGTLPSACIYDPKVLASIPVPERRAAAVEEASFFVWPVTAAYALAGIAWLPYFAAKTALILFNLLGYLGAVSLIARAAGRGERFRFRVLQLACLWPPFLENLRFAQVNALILGLIAWALAETTRQRPGRGGVLLAAASVFKLFPVSVAGFLALTNWRVPLAAAIALLPCFWYQPFGLWFKAMAGIHAIHRSWPYQILAESNGPWFDLYASTVLIASGLAAFHGRRRGPWWLGSLALAGVFLASPIAEYYHYTLLALPFAYLCLMETRRRHIQGLAALSAFLLILARFADILPGKRLVFLGLALLWTALMLTAATDRNTPRRAQPD